MNYERRVATLVSRMFDPFLMLAVVFVILQWGGASFVPAFIGAVVLPFVMYVAAWKTKSITDWDMNNRRQRPGILWLLVIIEVTCLFIFQLWSLLPILIIFIGFTVITHFWKISGHAMSAALATGLVISRFGWGFWPVLFVVPFVCWSRVVRKNHTTAQVIAGALYAWGIIGLLQLVKLV